MLRNHIRRSVIGAILGLLALGLYAMLAPKQYEGRSEVLLGAALADKYLQRPTAVTDDVLEILERGQPQSYQTEVEVLRSEGLFDDALQTVATKDNSPTLMQGENPQQLFLVYDVTNEPSSTVALIKTRGPSPLIAADLANAIIDAYNASREKRATDAQNEADAYLENQVTKAKTDLDTAQVKIRDYKLKNQVSDPTASITKITNTLVQLRVQESTIEGQYHSAVAEADGLGRELANIPPFVSGSQASVRNPEIDRLIASLNDLTAKRAKDLVDYQPDSIFVKEDNQSIAAVEEKLKEARRTAQYDASNVKTPNPVHQQIEQQYLSATARRDGLAKQFAQAQKDLTSAEQENAKFPTLQRELARLQLDADLDDLRYRNIKTLFDELHSRGVRGAHASQKLRTALPDDQVAAPNLLKYSAVGLLAGLTVGLLFSLSVESLRLRVYNSSQVSELTGVPVAAALPMGRGGSTLELLARNPDAPISEALKYVAFTSLANGKPKYKTVMFTEGGNALGGQTAALQYAIVLSQTGLKVALVDGDVRRRALSRAFHLESSPGLGDLIERTLLPGADSGLLHETVHPNLLFLPSGSGTATVITSAPSGSLEAFIEYLTQSADVVVISAPPCDQFADATRLAGFMDEVFLVIAAHRTSLPSVPRARDLLVNAGAKDVKVVLAGAERGDDGLTLQPRQAPAA